MKVDSEGRQRKALKARERGRQEVAFVHFASRLNRSLHPPYQIMAARRVPVGAWP